MYVEVIREEESRLRRKRWFFYVHAEANFIEIHVQGYYEEVRATRRHKYQVEKAYTRSNPRAFDAKQRLEMPPSTPAGVRDEVRRRINESTRFM